MKNSLQACVIGGLLTALTIPALADDGDVPTLSDAPDGQDAVLRGLQGPKGMISARVTLAINLSADLVGKPISLAPDLYYSVSDRLQLGLIHTGPMRWQARPGLGLCLTGDDSGCPSVYDNVGVDVMYGLLFGSQLHLAAHGGLFLNSFNPATAMLALGVAGKVHFGDTVAVVFDPQLGLALSDRDDHDDALFLPVELQFQAGKSTTLKLLTGITGSLSAFGDTYEVPVGVGAVRNLTKHFDVGARLSFDNLLGKQPVGVDAADTRSLALLLNIRN